MQVQLDLGRALETLGRLDEAEAAYRRAIVLAPNTPRSHYALGRLFQRQGKTAEAQRELEIHHKLYERGREAVSRYNVESAEMAYAWAEWHKGNAAVALARFQALPETPETLRGAAPRPRRASNGMPRRSPRSSGRRRSPPTTAASSCCS